MAENLLVRTYRTKWRKTRMCWCDDCRFFSEVERPVCPDKDSGKPGIQLWTMDVDMLGYKDYIDPLDTMPPLAIGEPQEEISVSTNNNNFEPA